MRYILFILLIVILAIGFSALRIGSKNLSPAPQEDAELKRDLQNAANQPQSSKPDTLPSESFNPPREAVITVVMTVKGRGDVTMELYPAVAPKTVARFVELVRSKFYDGILFHRVEPNFVVQAGDPQTRGMPAGNLARMSTSDIQAAGIGATGSGKPIPFEANRLQNIAGTVAIALVKPRSATGDSQFYVNLVSNHPLDGDYCVFGRVTRGMDVVKKIAKADEITRFVVR